MNTSDYMNATGWWRQFAAALPVPPLAVPIFAASVVAAGGLLAGLLAGCSDAAGGGEASSDGASDSATPDGSADSASDGDSPVDTDASANPSGDATDCQPADDTPTWNETVGAIVWQRCTTCHGEQLVAGAPFSLTSYAAVTAEWPPNSGTRVYERMAQQLSSDQMPPPSQPNLEAHEKDAILRWAAECAPEGNGEFRVPAAGGLTRVPVPLPPADARAVEFHAGDHAVSPADDSYVCFPFEIDLDGDPNVDSDDIEHIVRFDFDVDQTAVVHHIVLYADPNESFPDAPGPCTGMPADSLFLYAWAPGGQPLQFPPDMGLPVRDGDRVLLQVHYNNGAHQQNIIDDSGVAIYLAPPRPKEVGMVVTGPVAFELPGLAETSVYSQCRLPTDTTFIAAMPHMHKLGKALQVEVEREGGEWETVVEVKNWSFDDQPFYLTPFTVKAGERLLTTCTYENPSPKAVFSGEGTTDEMCFSFAYHYPPLNLAFCDQPLEEENILRFAPGSCAAEPPPGFSESPPATGGVKLSADLGFSDGSVPEQADWQLAALSMVLSQPETIVGTIDIEKTRFEAIGYARIHDGNLTAELDARGALVTASGATIPYDISLSESGVYSLDDQGRMVLTDPDACHDSGLPFRHLRVGQVDGDERVTLVGLYYELFNVTLLFEARWRPL